MRDSKMSKMLALNKMATSTLLEIEAEIDAEVAGPSAALSLTAGRIAEGIGDERHRGGDTVILEPGARAEPVPQQVPAGQGKLERRISEGTRVGRSLGGLPRRER